MKTLCFFIKTIIYRNFGLSYPCRATKCTKTGAFTFANHNPNNLHEEKLLFKIRTAYDPIYGLWGVLYEAKALLETYYNSNTSVGC